MKLGPMKRYDITPTSFIILAVIKAEGPARGLRKTLYLGAITSIFLRMVAITKPKMAQTIIASPKIRSWGATRTQR